MGAPDVRAQRPADRGSLCLRANPAAQGQEPRVWVDPGNAGWAYLRFAVHHLEPGKSLAGSTEGYETGLVILGGDGEVKAGGARFLIEGGRADVWERRPPHAVLLPPGTEYTVSARTAMIVAVAGARAAQEEAVPARHIRPENVVREERGNGQTRRYLHHVLPPSAPSARLQLVEVYTPGGNWSSFPPHKHDTEDPPREAYLEETYYFRIQPPEGFALQRVYTLDGSLDEALVAHDGDLVVVPRGFHPVAAMPGHECYYLNAMAGPNKAWNFTVDPRYRWLMDWTKPPVTENR